MLLRCLRHYLPRFHTRCVFLHSYQNNRYGTSVRFAVSIFMLLMMLFATLIDADFHFSADCRHFLPLTTFSRYYLLHFHAIFAAISC